MWRFIEKCKAHILHVIRLMRRFPYTSVSLIICVLTLLRHNQNVKTVNVKQEFAAVSSEIITSELFQNSEQDLQPKVNEELKFGNSEQDLQPKINEEPKFGNSEQDLQPKVNEELKFGNSEQDLQPKVNEELRFGNSEQDLQPKVNEELKLGNSEQDLQPKVNEELKFGISFNDITGGEGSERNGNEQTQPGDNAPDEVTATKQELHARTEHPGGQSVTKIEGKISSIQPSSRTNNWRNLTQTEINNLSVLGRRLYLQEDVGIPQNRNFTILAWECGPSIENRFLKQYGNVPLDPFRSCSVRNCNITYDSSLVDKADAILVALHKTRGPSTFPNRTNFKQRWIWLSDESPYHTFLVARDKNMSHYNGYFNWSMTYRMDSDIPVPYGRTIVMSDTEASLYEKVDYFNIKPNFTAIMGSNCGGSNKRWTYVKELKKYMDLDVYGGCGNLKCPGHFKRNCAALDTYKFYLSFENCNCRDYITEKAWWNAIEKGAVPVVMGGSVEGYKKHFPPKSFIHIDEFQSPKHLAEYLISLAKDAPKYMEYHAWRSRFRVLNEHGYFNTPVFHYCRICEALNYNNPRPKEYLDLDVFWNGHTDCSKPTWVDRMNGIGL